ncbi:MAG: DMT family transporter [Pseudomonadota bacterium]
MADIGQNSGRHDPLAGAIWMIAAGAAFAAVNSLTQYAAIKLNVPSTQVALLQYAIAFLAMLPWVAKLGLGSLRSSNVGLQVLRVVLAAGGVYFWLKGLAHPVPIWQAIALIMTSPFFVIVGAALILGERVGATRWIATAVGFVGGMIILQPWADDFETAALLPVAASVLWAASSLCVKRLSLTDSPATITIYLLVLLTPFNLVLAIPEFALPTGNAWWALIAAGIVTAGAQAFLALAYSRADAAYVQPFDHLKLPLNVAAGWYVFGWVPPGNLWIGAALIIGASLYVAQAEMRKTPEKSSANN